MTANLNELAARWRRSPDPDTTIALSDAVRGPLNASLIQEVSQVAKEKHASHVGVLVAVAKMYMSAHRLSDAQALLVNAGKVAPREASVYRVLGEVLLRRGDAERAEKVLERAAQFGANDADTRMWLERSKVFKAMQVQSGSRAVATEIERTSPAGLTPGRPAEAAAPPPPAAPVNPLLLPIPPLPEEFSEEDEPTKALIRNLPGDPPAGVSIPAAGIAALAPAPPPAPASAVSAPAPFSPAPSGFAGPQEVSVEFDLDRPGLEHLVPPKPQPPPAPIEPPTEIRPDRVESAYRAPAAPSGNPQPREILDALALAGVFEPPAGQPEVAQWDKPGRREGRRGSYLLVAMTMLFAGGVLALFYSVRERRAEQHVVAENTLTQVEAGLHAGRPALLPDLEKAFSSVFELDSRSQRAALDWLRERALVGLLTGGSDVAFEGATARAREVGLPEEQIAFAQLASFLFQGDTAGAAALLPRYDGPNANDAWYQMMAGATLERAGDQRALERYSAAVRLDPDLVVAQTALARDMAIDGDPARAGELARQFRAKYPDRAEGAALVALAWARDPSRTDQPPPEAAMALQRASELPRSLAVVPHATAAILALDKHTVEEARAEVKKGLLVADGPGAAAWLGSIAIATDDPELARKAALTAVAFSAVYAPARVLAARVALLGDRLDEALKATEDLDPGSPDVAIVRAAAAYERTDADGLSRALAPVSPEAKKLAVMAPLASAETVLAGRARVPKEKILELAGIDAPWSDLVAMDLALDLGELGVADKIAADWKGSEKLPLRALRLARLARYEGRLDDAETLSVAAIESGTVTLRSLSERVLVLVARNKAADATPLLAKYPLVLGPIAIWLSAYAQASLGKVDDAKAKTSTVDPPPPGSPVPARLVAVLALGKMTDYRRGPDYVRDLVQAGFWNPDVSSSGLAFGLRVATRK